MMIDIGPKFYSVPSLTRCDLKVQVLDLEFLDRFYKKLSFEIAMSGQAGVTGKPFFKVMLPLFFSRLLSYSVGMKRRTSSVSRARETTLSFFII